jgi:prevent-host-death family protein
MAYHPARALTIDVSAVQRLTEEDRTNNRPAHPQQHGCEPVTSRDPTPTLWLRCSDEDATSEDVVAEAGVRDLRDHLSSYLARVRAGEELTVTDRGRPIARLVPVGGTNTFDRLIAEGLVVPAASPRRARPTTRVSATGPVSDLVAEQRR